MSRLDLSQQSGVYFERAFYFQPRGENINAQTASAQFNRAKHHTAEDATFLLELPLRVTLGQAKRLRAHLEAARQFYNAILSEGQHRLRQMRADPAWQEACAIPRSQKLERKRAFGALRQRYGFSEYALHNAAKTLNCSRDSRPPGCGTGPDVGESRLSRPQPGMFGAGAARAVQE